MRPSEQSLELVNVFTEASQNFELFSFHKAFKTICACLEITDLIYETFKKIE